jgi:LPXTG-motif cell wall-anchored protein
MRNESSRAIVLSIAALVSIVIFGFGLIGPLTPSEGVPPLSEILFFLGLPLLLSGGGLYISRRKSERFFLSAVIATIVIVAAKVLWLVFTTA